MTFVFDEIPRLLVFTDDEIVICSSDEHPLKASYSIEITDEGIVICFNDEHPLKA